jgi:hypothetical protein
MQMVDLALWKVWMDVVDMGKQIGEGGYRSRCLAVANDALYQVSYIPVRACEALRRSGASVTPGRAPNQPLIVSSSYQNWRRLQHTTIFKTMRERALRARDFYEKHDKFGLVLCVSVHTFP